MEESTEGIRSWEALPDQVLQQIFQDDPSTALRRPARAVCSPWRAFIDAEWDVQQVYCDVGDMRLLQSFTKLRSVIIDELGLVSRLMRQRQQRRWAIQKQQQQAPQPFSPLYPLLPDNNSSSSSSGGGGSSRQRQLHMPQHVANLGRLEIFGPPDLDLSPLAQLPGLQDVTLRCIHLIKQLPLHTVHLTHVTSLTLHQTHTFGRQRVDNLPWGLQPLQKLQRLVLIGIQQESVAALFEYTGGHVRRPLLYLARFLEDGAERGAYSSSSQQQQLEQDQQPEQQQQQQVAGRPETSGSCYVRSPLPFLTQIVGEQVHLARSEVTGGADAASVEAVMAAAAAAGAAAADAAGDTIGPTSSRGPRPARPLPCPWLGNLQCLVLRSCGLKRLPAPALASLTAVTSLNLSNNRLRLLPPGLRFLKQLQVLLLDNNSSMRIGYEEPWSRLTALTHLSLSSCATLLGEGVYLRQLLGLQRLGAADNGRADLSWCIRGCTALKVLDIRGTHIDRSLSDTLIHHLPALQRCLYGPWRGGQWVAAARDAAEVSGWEMVRDRGWVGTKKAQEAQDYWGPGDWVDQEASSGSSSSEEEGEEGESSSEEGSDDSQTDPGTDMSEHSTIDSEEVTETDNGSWVEELEDSGGWEEEEAV